MSSINQALRKSKMKMPGWLPWSSFGVAVALAIAFAIKLVAAPSDYVIAQKPLYLAQSEPPLMMMVMSRDEQLFKKAYSDYSDLNSDGILDVTYTDSFNYSGYFDSHLCYAYESSQFKAAAAANGANGHSCGGSGHWSGNFLNWMTMTRLDIVRHVLYGGRRSVDQANRTVLERAHIPSDLHAWVKVYSGSDINQFTPLTGVQSFCNTSQGNGADEPPLFRQAAGNWSEWAATALQQCQVDSETSSGETQADIPGSAINYNVRVEVCDPGAEADLREEFCGVYNDGTTAHYKPTGLLQRYGESGRLRFGLISGTYSNPRSGGVLRRNIGRFSGNGAGCTGGNEVDLSTGQLCNQTDGVEGVVNTIDRFRLTQWNFGSSSWSDCGTYGILNRQGNDRLNNPGVGDSGVTLYNCSAWGNPVAEMYAEALRYIGGETTPHSAFTGGTDLTGMPRPGWLDPYRSKAQGGNSYCASCSILVMASSLPAFDSDEIPEIPQIGNSTSISAATDNVGVLEEMSGSYMVGRATATPANTSLNTHEDTCVAKPIDGLGTVRGVCPDIPSLEGSYLIAGMAHRAKTVDMRPGLQEKPSDYRNTVTTYGVALADSLPKFSIPVGTGEITLAPLCQANNSGTAGISTAGWRTCFLGSVGVGPKTSSVSPNHVYGRALQEGEGNPAAGSFSLVWEDSLWGNDNDNDVVAMLTYCVGSACDADTNPANNASFTGKDICWRSDSTVCDGGGRPTVSANEVLVRIENLSAYAGNAMLSGFSVIGSNDDGVHRLALRPGNSNGSVLTTTAEPRADWYKPKVLKFTLGTGDARVLESPLWYAAKYGGFRDTNGNGNPDSGEWDTRVQGQPDNYFFARDPSALKTELERIFESAANRGATTAGGGAGARIGDSSFTLEAGYEVPDESVDWIGYLRALRVSALGGRDEVLWNADIPSPAARNIITTLTPTILESDGSVDAEVVADDFLAVNLGPDDASRFASLGVPTPIPVWLGATPSVGTLVDYLRGTPVSGYRARSSVLGSIINSQPKVASPTDDFGYGDWAFSAPSTTHWRARLAEGYGDYLETKATGRIPMVYVGANDGMLHGFNASQSSLNGGGDEEFAFIPSTSRAHMYELANPNYEHKYFVDGGIAVADVSFGTAGNGSWHTVLVGSTGGGGASIPIGGSQMGHGSVFALDVSDPEHFDDGDVLWELSGADDEDLGFVLGDPVIVPVAGPAGAPRWVAMFGNGPNSENGRPALYVVDIETGERLAKLFPTGTAFAGRNGLMNIAPVAVENNDGLVDTVYGGDLLGNLWKFDLSNTNPTSWEIAFAGEPLFTAGIGSQVQPITGGIEISSGPGGGTSIFFGTGSYFAEEDATSSTVQSFYGIWDNGTRITTGRTALVQQAITTGTDSNGYTTRNVTSNTVSYLTDRGWYVDLRIGTAQDGERFIAMPRLQSGRVVFPTYEPTTAAVCSAGGGINWEYALDLLTGQPRMGGITLDPGGESVCVGECGAIGLNGDPAGGGQGDSGGAPIRSTDIFVPRLVPCDPSDPACTVDELIDAEQCTFVLRAAGAAPLYLPRPCGRQSWRQVR